MPRMCRSVDLPAAAGPMIDTNSPRWMSRVIRRSTNACPYPCAYAFSRLRSEMSASTDIYPRLKRRTQRAVVRIDLLRGWHRRCLQLQRARFLFADDPPVEEMNLPFGMAGV